MTHFSAALAIKGAILGTNTLKPYQKLCLESLQNRRKSRRLSLFYKIYKNQSSLYLYKIIPAKTPGNWETPIEKRKEIFRIKVKHRFFKKFFFPGTTIEWNDLDYSLHNAPSIKFDSSLIEQNENALFGKHEHEWQ